VKKFEQNAVGLPIVPKKKKKSLSSNVGIELPVAWLLYFILLVGVQNDWHHCKLKKNIMGRKFAQYNHISTCPA